MMQPTSLLGVKASPPATLSAVNPLPRAATSTDGKLRTLYVYLCNGRVEVMTLCKAVKLNGSEMVVYLGDGSTRRFRRTDVYLASWARVTPPVMF